VVTALCRPFFLPCQIAIPIFKYILHDYVFQKFPQFTATQNNLRAKQEIVRVGIILDLWLVNESYELFEDYVT
jgi:hypothetical protein